MNKTLSKFKKEIITDSNDYKRTRQYNKLTPKMKKAVDMVFRAADKSADVIADFEKNVKAFYEESELFAEKAEFSNSKSFLVKSYLLGGKIWPKFSML